SPSRCRCFNRNGMKMTFFSVTSGGMFAGWTKLQNAASYGHEIASHTVTHANLSGLSLAQQAAELTNSQNAINANVTTQLCVSLAYPNCASGSDSLTAQYYMVARNCSGVVNPASPGNFMQISCFICGPQGTIQTLANFTSVANSAASMNGWGVYLIHGIDNDGGYSPLPSSILQASVDYFSSNTNRYWVETFGNVARYIKERNDATVVETGSAAASITLQVTHTLDNSIYNYPITVRRPLPAAWPWAIVAQNGAAVPSQIVTNASQPYVMFNVVPNGGEVTISRIDSPGSQFRLVIPSTATEGDGLLAGQGNVAITEVLTNDLVVDLQSSDTSEVTVPSSVILLAGQTNATFDLNIIDDSVLDGDQIATITATAPGYGMTQASITVHDNDAAELIVTLPATASEGDGVLTGAGVVSVATPVGGNIVVNLSSSDTSKLVVPPTTMIPIGQTSAVFNLTIIDDARITGPQIVTVTARVSSATVGYGSITILDNDPLPDHFVWSIVPSPQLIGEPFQVTITAQDAANNTASYFIPVSINALLPTAAPGTNTVLGSPSPDETLYDGDEYVLGYSFTPSTNLVVTHARHYFGDNVSIWTDSGLLVASQDVTSIPGTWVDTPFATPVLLLAGATYRVGVHERNADYFWSDNLPGTFPDGTINQSWWDYGTAFPNQTDDVRWYSVDLRYATDVVSVPVTPSLSGSFTNGTWSGNIAVLQPATNLYLEASVGTGHAGLSAPVTVLGTPKLAIAAAGKSIVLSWPAAAAEFNLEQTSVLSPAPNWTSVLDGQILIGDRYTVTNTISSTNMFYRLAKP
ncbi:MAG TPA: polysaccharide deacetylase family protein, partial [Verrucomicrobiae bacterium]|nr:polysaccharide deacetylase family protein [Verrucomicrobiae bacterium]